MLQKRLPIIVLLIVLMAAITACATEVDEATEAPPTEEPTEEVMEETEEPMADDEPMASPTIAEIAAGDDNFSTLVAALDAAGLVETMADADAEFTVFAPTNDAFEAAFSALGITAEDLLADTEALTNILLYHVVEGAVTSDVVVTLDSATTLQGSDVMIKVDMGNVYINESKVVQADIEASNGVIHVIDSVLLPPAEEAKLSIAEIAVGDENFSTLVAALSAAGLVETFAGEGSFTVFAPTNDAFAAAFEALGITADDLLADTDALPVS